MNDKFKEKLMLNIAISEIKDEERVAMKNHKFNLKKSAKQLQNFLQHPISPLKSVVSL